MGFERERTLAKLLAKYGWRAYRMPVSGSWGLPDVIAFKNGKIAAFEVKTCLSKPYVYVDLHQLLKVLDFARSASLAAPCEAVVAAYFGKGRWVFRRIPDNPVKNMVVRSTDDSDWTP